MIQFEEQFQPYTRDGHTLTIALRYWGKVATDHGIGPDVLELAINEIFGEMAGGKEFSKDHCPCGCGIDKAATALIHAVRDRMFEIDDKGQIAFKDLLQQRFNVVIEDQLRQIALADRAYIKANRPSLKERSPVLRGIRKLKRGA